MKTKLLYTLLFACTLVSCDEEPAEGSYYITEIKGESALTSGITLNIEDFTTLYRVNGNDGCNTYGADVEIMADKTLNIGPVMATKMYCPDVQELAKKYMTQLANVKTYKLRGSKLSLKNANGKTILVAKRFDDDETIQDIIEENQERKELINHSEKQ